MTTGTVKKIGLMLLTNVRASHLYVYETYTGKPTPQNPNPIPLHKGNFLMDATHPDLPRVAQMIEAVGSAHKWQGGLTWEVVKASLSATNMLCLKRGDVACPGDPVYAGLFFVKASNKKDVAIYNGDRSIWKPGDRRVYSGAYVNATIDIWAQDNGWGRRINATLTGVQFVRDGTAFGGGAAPATPEEFPVVAMSADAPPPAAGADPLAGLV